MLLIYIYIYLSQLWFEGNVTGTPPYLGPKTMVSPLILASESVCPSHGSPHVAAHLCPSQCSDGSGWTQLLAGCGGLHHVALRQNWGITAPTKSMIFIRNCIFCYPFSAPILGDRPWMGNGMSYFETWPSGDHPPEWTVQISWNFRFSHHILPEGCFIAWMCHWHHESLQVLSLQLKKKLPNCPNGILWTSFNLPGLWISTSFLVGFQCCRS